MAARPVSAVRRAARLLARNSGGDSAPRGARERTGKTRLAAGRATLRRSGRARLGTDRVGRPGPATEPPPDSCQAPGLGRLSPLICLLCCAAPQAPTGYLLARPRSAAMRARCGLAGQPPVCRSPRTRNHRAPQGQNAGFRVPIGGTPRRVQQVGRWPCKVSPDATGAGQRPREVADGRSRCVDRSGRRTPTRTESPIPPRHAQPG
jgi:hypothetical protein